MPGRKCEFWHAACTEGRQERIMRWMSRDPSGRFRLCESVEIDESVESVFAHWIRFEEFPRIMASVRRIKRIDERTLLWDVDIGGRQVVWEARIEERVPEKLVRWESRWGAPNAGEVRFEALADDRTRLTVSLDFRPQRPLERLGAHLGWVHRSVQRDLEQFRGFVEHVRLEEANP